MFPTVHRKTNFLVKLYWGNKYSDSDSESDSHLGAQILNKVHKLKAHVMYLSSE